MNATAVLLGRAPGETFGERVKLAAFRALRTFLQGVAGAFPSAGAGAAILTTGYWETFGFACLAALIAGVVSFLQNIADFFPVDPTQKQPNR